MSDTPTSNPVAGLITLLAILMAAPFFIAAIPILAGIAVGVLFYLMWTAFFYAVWQWFKG